MTSCNIFDIKRYAINDGPGIRTTIFLKGCPLRCVWCHNPEGWTTQRQLLYKKSKCIGCGTCATVCRQHAISMAERKQTSDRQESPILYDQDRCITCGQCANECPTTALEICGQEWTLDRLMAEIEKERDIMTDSGGGVTLCGGEPLMHADYVKQLLDELGRRGFHRTVDTTLYASWNTIEQINERCELWLVDLKLMDAQKHLLYTGADNSLILQNIVKLAQARADFFIRIPLIEGVNADDENLEQTARFLAPLPWLRRTVCLLPYHDVGRDKHRRMWSQYNPEAFTMRTPDDETINRWACRLRAAGLNVIEGG